MPGPVAFERSGRDAHPSALYMPVLFRSRTLVAAAAVLAALSVGVVFSGWAAPDALPRGQASAAVPVPATRLSPADERPPLAWDRAPRLEQVSTVGRVLVVGRGDGVALTAAVGLNPGERLLTPFVDVRDCQQVTLSFPDAQAIRSTGGRIEVQSSADGETVGGVLLRTPADRLLPLPHDLGQGHLAQLSLSDDSGGFSVSLIAGAPYIRVGVLGVERAVSLGPITLFCPGGARWLPSP